MERLYNISDVALSGYILSFKVNGITVTCDLTKVSDVLAKASKEQVANMIVDPVGVGFHWPALDEDLSVNGILRELGINQLAPGKEETPAYAELVCLRHLVFA
ncbi:DUF2442 domain-containing protein [candidate division KSB1 bacterium]|nr:DUF2442 domain-containing protein [candidate division KSB1 bacterium]